MHSRLEEACLVQEEVKKCKMCVCMCVYLLCYRIWNKACGGRLADTTPKTCKAFKRPRPCPLNPFLSWGGWMQWDRRLALQRQRRLWLLHRQRRLSLQWCRTLQWQRRLALCLNKLAAKSAILDFRLIKLRAKSGILEFPGSW